MIPDYRIATVISATLLFAAGVAFGVVRPRSRMHQFMALFLVIYGLGLVANSFWSSATVSDSLAERLAIYAWIATPFAAVAFALAFLDTYGAWRGRVSGKAYWLLLAAAVAVETWYFVDHSVFTRSPGGMTIVVPFLYLGWALSGVAFLRAAVATPEALPRKSLMVMGTAFLLLPAFRSAMFAAEYVTEPEWGGAISVTATALHLGAVLGILEAARMAAMRLREHRIWAVVLAPVVLGVLMRPINVALDLLGTLKATLWLTVLFGLDAVFVATAVVALGYGLFNCTHLNIELRVRNTLQYGGVLLGAAAVGTFVGLVLQGFTTTSRVDTLAAAAVMAMGAVVPMWFLMRRFASRLIRAPDAPGYEEQRSRQMYEHALEAGVGAGELSEEDRIVLDGLRHSAGMDGDGPRVGRDTA